MEFVYSCQTHKDSAAIVYLHSLRAYNRVERTPLQSTGCDNAMPQVALSLSLSALNQHAHILKRLISSRLLFFLPSCSHSL